MLPSAPLVITIVSGGAGCTKCNVTHTTTISNSRKSPYTSAASRHETWEILKRGMNGLRMLAERVVDSPSTTLAATRILRERGTKPTQHREVEDAAYYFHLSPHQVVLGNDTAFFTSVPRRAVAVCLQVGERCFSLCGRGCEPGTQAALWQINGLGYCSEFARAVVPARVKLNLTSMIRCFSESVGANFHFLDASTASRSK